jgi:hypothetical protein
MFGGEPGFLFEFTTGCLLGITVGIFDSSPGYLHEELTGGVTILADEHEATVCRNRHDIYPVGIRQYVIGTDLLPRSIQRSFKRFSDLIVFHFPSISNVQELART